MITTEPNSEYDGLRRQFLSLRTLANAQAKTIAHLRERLDALAACNNAAELESQREAFAQLTNDVATPEAKLEAKLEASKPTEQSFGVIEQCLHEHRDVRSEKAADYEVIAAVKREVLRSCRQALKQVNRFTEPQLQWMTRADYKILSDDLRAELIDLGTSDLTAPFTPFDIDKDKVELEQQAVSNFIRLLTLSGQFNDEDIRFIEHFCELHIAAEPVERLALISAANYMQSLKPNRGTMSAAIDSTDHRETLVDHKIKRQRYQANRRAPLGTDIECANCGRVIRKKQSNTQFCSTRGDKSCENQYWSDDAY